MQEKAVTTRKPKRPYKCLTWQQRLQLEAYLKAKLPKKEIAQLLGVHISTVYRELQRGTYKHKKAVYDYYGFKEYKYTERYSPDIAEEKYRQKVSARGNPLKIGKDYELSNYIEKRIVEEGLTPLAVLGEIERNDMKFKTKICIRTLYNYINKGVFLRLSLKHLPIKSKKKPHKRKIKRAAKPSAGTSIEKRPVTIDDRADFGNWEMDCVEGKKKKKETLLCLSERFTRREIIVKIPDKITASVVNVLNTLERKYGELFSKIFKTITVDNGVEFSDCIGMETSIHGGQRTKIYYCHPYSSYERGTNERLNREIRRKIPKGADLTTYSNEDVQAVEDWMNNYPRQVLGFATPNELFNACLSSI